MVDARRSTCCRAAASGLLCVVGWEREGRRGTGEGGFGSPSARVLLRPAASTWVGVLLLLFPPSPRPAPPPGAAAARADGLPGAQRLLHRRRLRVRQLHPGYERQHAAALVPGLLLVQAARGQGPRQHLHLHEVREALISPRCREGLCAADFALRTLRCVDNRRQTVLRQAFACQMAGEDTAGPSARGSWRQQNSAEPRARLSRRCRRFRARHARPGARPSSRAAPWTAPRPSSTGTSIRPTTSTTAATATR